MFNNKKVPISLKEHQEIMLKMMISFDEYCNKRNLRYFLIGGTLLGAVRHKGFIPWDDDVDIVMPRPDYEQLINDARISENYDIVSITNPHGYYHPFAYCNIADRKTIMFEHNSSKQTGKGIFLDVFPLDGIPNDNGKKIRHLQKLVNLERMFSIGVNSIPGFGGLKNAIKSLIHVLEIPMDKVKLGLKIQNEAKKYLYEECEYVTHSVLLLNHPERFIAPKEDYKDFILLSFEGYKFKCPIGYKNILSRSFGDYMKLPPENERIGHHGIEIYKR